MIVAKIDVDNQYTNNSICINFYREQDRIKPFYYLETGEATWLTDMRDLFEKKWLSRSRLIKVVNFFTAYFIEGERWGGEQLIQIFDRDDNFLGNDWDFNDGHERSIMDNFGRDCDLKNHLIFDIPARPVLIGDLMIKLQKTYDATKRKILTSMEELYCEQKVLITGDIKTDLDATVVRIVK